MSRSSFPHAQPTLQYRTNMSGLADYLAKNYLTADSEKKSKKRKRKNKDSGLVIEDEDNLGWKEKADEDDEDAPMIGKTNLILSVCDSSANVSFLVGGGTLKKSKKKSKGTGAATWTTVGVAAPSNAEQLAADAAAADAIIAGTAADRRKADEAEDEAPEVVDPDGVLRLETGAKAGLQTAAEVAAAMKKKQDDERRKAKEVAKEMGSAAQETIYRDASGRVINVAMKRAEARKKVEEEERKEREIEKAARGDVQNAETERRKQQLADAKTMTIARYADDAELNDELKERGHWNDPASGFLRKKKAGRSVTGKPLYKGSFQPNRYSIRPGHRWDGIDRGNGFEKQWFDSRNRKSDVAKLEYQWQMDE
jgi:pre-mRNA-splicing factor CWC26